MALQFQPNFLGNLLGTNAPMASSMGLPVPIDQGPIDLSGFRAPLDLPSAAPKFEAGAKPRHSILDIIGGIGDVFAKVGGADAQYQPQIDARTERARQVDTDAMRRKQFELQQRQGEQSLEKGGLDIADEHRQVLGQATRGLAAVYERGGAPALEKAWPMLSQQLQIPPQQAALFGEALRADPEGTITALHSALTDPTKQGSPPKELQVMALLDKRDPSGKLSQTYLNSLATGMDKNEEGRLNFQYDNMTSRERTAARRQAWLENPNNPRNAPKPARAGKAAEDTSASAASFRDVLGGMRENYENLRRDGSMVRKGGAPVKNIVAGARASGLGQIVEGYVGTNAQTYRDNIKNARPALVQSIAQATGMTAKQLDSNADMKLMLSQATDPTQSYESNMAALARLEDFVARRQSAPAPRPRTTGTLSPRRGAPAARGGWKVIEVK